MAFNNWIKVYNSNPTSVNATSPDGDSIPLLPKVIMTIEGKFETGLPAGVNFISRSPEFNPQGSLFNASDVQVAALPGIAPTDLQTALSKYGRFATRALTNDATAALADMQSQVEITKSSGSTYTIPLNASVAFPINAQIEIIQCGSGQITVAVAGGATLRNSQPTAKTRAQWSVVKVRQRAIDEWVISGDLAQS